MADVGTASLKSPSVGRDGHLTLNSISVPDIMLSDRRNNVHKAVSATEQRARQRD